VANKVLLFGNPNVGKSAVFSRLSGARVNISNYPGSTVEFTEGKLKIGSDVFSVIDVPGTYSLHPFSKAEEVAVNMLSNDDIIINVVDATNIERNLFLTLQLADSGCRMVVALNMWDDTKHKGIYIDIEKLEKELGVPVVPTCGLTGDGIKKLADKLNVAKNRTPVKRSDVQRWEEVGKIASSVQKLTHRHHTLLERLEDLSLHPVSGLAIAVFVIFISFGLIRFIGEGLINNVMDPVFDLLWMPLMQKLSVFFGSTSVVHKILIGDLINGSIDLKMSMGVLTTGIYIQLAAILPYILSFYLVLGILEDLGYLPRLAVLADNIMHKLGLHGYAVIPMILSLGCKVPGILSTRMLEERREKFIASALVAMAVPCMSQIAMIIGLVGQKGGQYLSIVFGTLFIVLVVKGILLNKFMPGTSPEILVEIPPYRIPDPLSVLKKLWMRLVGYLVDAMPYVLLGVLIVNLMYILNIIQFLADIFSPLVTKLWGLPKEAVSALLIGFMRKDVAVAMLAPLGLTVKQMVVGSTVLALYFPCIATFMVLLKELGTKDMLKITGLMITVAGLVGFILNVMPIR